MKIIIPTECPSCGFSLEIENSQLFCRNQACSAQLGKKLEHFCKTLGIKGLGAKTLEKLQLADVTEIYYLDFSDLTEKLGSEKIAAKLLEEIDKSRSADLQQVLPAFSIALFGTTAASKLCKVVSSIDEITVETCKQAGLGDKVTQNLLGWIETDFQEMKEFLPFSFKTSSTPVNTNITANAKSVCITGKLQSFKTKSEATKALELAGFLVTDSVTKNTDYLVDEDNKGSTKRIKADSLGVIIIQNLKQFLIEELTND